jgi:hypothetical protein
MMRIEKWMGEYMKENSIMIEKYVSQGDIEMTPKNWTEHKDILMAFIANVDALTEVYNMENGKRE